MQGLRLKLMLVAAALFAAPSAMGQNAPAAPATGLALGRPVTGDLTPSDAQRHSGKYEDAYTIEGRRGDRVQLDLASADFDAYLVVTGPGGFTIANDDADGRRRFDRQPARPPTARRRRLPGRGHQLPPGRDRRLPARRRDARRRQCRGDRAARRFADRDRRRPSPARSPAATAAPPTVDSPITTVSPPAAASASPSR